MNQDLSFQLIVEREQSSRKRQFFEFFFSKNWRNLVLMFNNGLKSIKKDQDHKKNAF